jgi:hypothetical protein
MCIWLALTGASGPRRQAVQHLHARSQTRQPSSLNRHLEGLEDAQRVHVARAAAQHVDA